MSTIPEEDSQQSSSVARQVFPEENPSMTVPESEAKVAEDILAASAEEEEERRKERFATPPATNQVILEENLIVQDPPVIDQMEVENNDCHKHC